MNLFSKWFKKSDNKKETANNPELKKLGESMQLVALGSMLGQSGDFERAIKVLKKAIKINPEGIEANIPLAMAYRGKNMLDEALEILHQVEKKSINSKNNSVMDFDLYFTFTTIYIRKDDKANASKYARKAIEADKNPTTKKKVNDAIRYGVMNNTYKIDRANMVAGLKEVIKEYN